MRYFILSLYFLLKNFIRLKFVKPNKMYNVSEFKLLRGTELQYLSNDICLKVYIAGLNEKSITLMGRWYDDDTKKYEDADTVIYCLPEAPNELYLLEKVNLAMHTGVWLQDRRHRTQLSSGKIDHLCPFNK